MGATGKLLPRRLGELSRSAAPIGVGLLWNGAVLVSATTAWLDLAKPLARASEPAPHVGEMSRRSWGSRATTTQRSRTVVPSFPQTSWVRCWNSSSSSTTREWSCCRYSRCVVVEGWWDEYANVTDAGFPELIGLESGATSIRVYEGRLVPGLLQTDEYPRGLLW
jgi:hypothetical protein